MRELSGWESLRPGGVVVRGETAPPETGAWRTGLKPRAVTAACVNCLLCWLYCPDSAVLVDGTTFAGFDYRYCKGCELCAAACPTGAIEMVPEEEDVPPAGLVREDGDGR
jgi:2-oxoacid:acceptor oxidoreductase delta subunit (pyruvate/2-ketoisovalerate family)